MNATPLRVMLSGFSLNSLLSSLPRRLQDSKPQLSSGPLVSSPFPWMYLSLLFNARDYFTWPDLLLEGARELISIANPGAGSSPDNSLVYFYEPPGHDLHFIFHYRGTIMFLSICGCITNVNSCGVFQNRSCNPKGLVRFSSRIIEHRS